MADKATIFQRLNNMLIGASRTAPSTPSKSISSYHINAPSDTVLFSTTSKEERDQKLLQMRQQKLMAHQWAKTGYDVAMEQLNGASQVQLMYRDADLMDAWPEIGAALDIVAEECTVVNPKGKIINVYSKSERIKSILEDLFTNRLDFHVLGSMIARSLCKYGNEYMLLNLDSKEGVMGWRELPVYYMNRIENGLQTLMGGNGIGTMSSMYGLKPDEVAFVWQGHNDSTPYKNFQVAHFRLITDSLLLPYGVSWLNKARRHWRMLSMMEDAMLIYRLDKSIERRVYKVNVGGIDEADVPAFIQELANGFKRGQIIDPKTGQVDLRKNFLDVTADYFIPIRNGQDQSEITNLPSAQSPTSMDDIKYMENKVLSALKIPKSFLNFEDNANKSQNMSLLDIRFNRTINRIQQAILLELNKIAIIHLKLLGLDDDLTNFTLSMNNPSNQIELTELENLTKRLSAASNALQDQGGGLRLMSWYQVQREIMGKTDKEIVEILNQLRLESAAANEIEKTPEIIKRTGIFNPTDRIYGEPNANYAQGEGGNDGDDGFGGGGGGPMLGGGEGFDLGDPDDGGGLGDLGEPGAPDDGEMGGDTGSMPLSDMPTENIHQANGRNILKEMGIDDYIEYVSKLNTQSGKRDILSKALLINEEIDTTIKSINEAIKQPVENKKVNKRSKKA